MKCFISYRRDSADTINGETLIASQRYTTFDKAEMDRLEDYLKSSVGCGVLVEYDIDKCIDNEKEANDVVLQRIRDEIEETIESYVCDTEENTMKAQGMLNAMQMTFEIIDNYKNKNNGENND